MSDIAEANQRRHNHWNENDVSHCKHCGSFISLPEPENGKITYVCPACNRAIMQWVGKRKKATP